MPCSILRRKGFGKYVEKFFLVRPSSLSLMSFSAAFPFLLWLGILYWDQVTHLYNVEGGIR